MAVKFFGQFLVGKGAVSRETLLQAIELQESVNLNFGDLAIKMGLMSQQDVVLVNQAQRTEDQRFGEMAVKLGFINEQHIQQILTEQKNSHLCIGEALIRVGGLKEADLQRYLEEFKADQALYSTDQVTIPPSAPHGEICELMADLTYKMLIRIAKLRFRLEPCRVTEYPAANDIGAAINFTGDVTASYIFSLSRKLQMKIASAILNEPDVRNESQELLDDTVMEFVNVVCGNIAAKAIQSGKKMDIDPPRLVVEPEKLQAAENQTGLSFPICFPDGERAELAVFVAQ